MGNVAPSRCCQTITLIIPGHCCLGLMGAQQYLKVHLFPSPDLKMLICEQSTTSQLYNVSILDILKTYIHFKNSGKMDLLSTHIQLWGTFITI